MLKALDGSDVIVGRWYIVSHPGNSGSAEELGVCLSASDFTATIEFVNNIRGHDGACNGRFGHCWCCGSRDILREDKVTTVVAVSAEVKL